MGEVIDFCFNGCDKECTGITRYGDFWTNSQEKYKFYFYKTSFKLAISCLLARQSLHYLD